MMTLEQVFKEALSASIALKQQVLERLLPEVRAAGELLVAAYSAGNKALFIGNGGSAADAQHLSAEFEGRFRLERAPLPALALHTNVSSLTAIANDYSYDQVYSRLITAHGRPNDVLIAISTSGVSKCILVAAETARKLGLRVVALVGENSSAIAPFSDVVISVPSNVTARIQEVHILLGHVLCEYVESSLFGGTND